MGPSRAADEKWAPSLALACVLMSLLKAPAAWFQLYAIFGDADVNFTCAKNITDLKSITNTTEADQLWDNACYIEVANKTQPLACSLWVYDESLFTNTISTEWDLVCDDGLGSVIISSSFFISVLFGNIIFGQMADRIGRKTALMFAIIVQAFSSVLVSFSTSFPMFLASRGVLGLAVGGIIVVSAVLCGEMVTKKWKVLVSLWMHAPFGLGQGVLAITAYFFRDWRDMNFTLALFSFIFILYYWVVPESPKWLLNRQRHRNMELVSSVNDPNIEKEKTLLAQQNFVSATKEVTIMYLMREPIIRRYSLTVFILWFFAGLGFFSMNPYQAKLGGDIFFNLAFAGIVGSIPETMACVYLVNKFGRKYTIIVFHFISGLCVILVPTINLGDWPEDWPRRVLGLITVMGMSVCYPILFMYSGELFDDNVRSKVISLAVLWHRLGTIVAPFVGITAPFSEWLPPSIICSTFLFNTLIMTTLPEIQDLSRKTKQCQSAKINGNQEEGSNNDTTTKFLPEPNPETT